MYYLFNILLYIGLHVYFLNRFSLTFRTTYWKAAWKQTMPRLSMTTELWPWRPAQEAKTTGSAADCPEHSGHGQWLPVPECLPLLPIRANQRKLNMVPKSITQDARLQLLHANHLQSGHTRSPFPTPLPASGSAKCKFRWLAPWLGKLWTNSQSVLHWG